MFEKIRSIISEQLSIDDVDTITLDTSLTEDLEADFFRCRWSYNWTSWRWIWEIEIPDEESWATSKTIGRIIL